MQFPNVTVRYFALNWPEYCILAFTDTNIPEGIIMAYPEEPQKARITTLGVKNVLARRNIYRTLLNLEIKKLKEGGIEKVVLSPRNETPEKNLFEIFCHFEPFRRLNIKGEYYFNI
nr:n acetyltransferase mak3 [Hymenolepis microstoma]